MKRGWPLLIQGAGISCQQDVSSLRQASSVTQPHTKRQSRSGLIITSLSRTLFMAVLEQCNRAHEVLIRQVLLLGTGGPSASCHPTRGGSYLFSMNVTYSSVLAGSAPLRWIPQTRGFR